MNLLALRDLTPADLAAIWSLASGPDRPLLGTAAWSFEGNGVRTRTTFLQAFRDLGLAFTELPNFLKTGERVEDLAGYLDPFFSVYVIRESNHERLAAFAATSSRPVVNAMSSRGHPCEVLADAYFVDRFVRPLAKARICLWGPTTNVFRSWHELARVTGAAIVQVCPAQHHESDAGVEFTADLPRHADVVITDGWPQDVSPAGLSLDHLARMGSPALLPTPPFTIGREILFDPATYPGFVGYRQKQWLLPVQKAILRHVTSTH